MPEAIQERESVAREIRTAARHSAVYGLGAMAVKAIGFLMLPVYTHYLTPLDYGVLEILDLSMSLLGMFLGMGMTAALLRYYGAAGSLEEKNKVVSTALIFVIGTGLLMFSMALAFVRPVSALLFGPRVPSSYLLLSFSSFVLGYIANLPRSYLRALEASGKFVALDTLGVLASLVMNVVFLVVLKMGVAGILLSALLVNVAWIPVSGWVFHRVGAGFHAPLLRRMVAFGLPLIFSNLALFTLNFSDRFFLQHFQTLEVVGVYSVGYKFGFMMNFLLVQPFLGMWQARMYIIHGQPDYAKIYGQIFVLYSVVLIYAGLALAMLSPEIVHVMVGPKFSSGQEVIPLIVLAYIFYGIGYYTQLGMFLTNNTKVIGMIGAGVAVLNLGLNYFLIRNYGMMGAAWATMLSFLAIAVANYWFSQRLLPLPLGTARVMTATAMAMCFYVLALCWRLDSLVIALLMKGALLVAFPLLLWKSGILSQSEIGTVVSSWDLLRERVSRLFDWGPRVNP